MRPFALAILPLAALATQARADWQYTKWGMTPAQVVAASGGKVMMLPPERRAKLPPLETSVEGTFQDGPIALRTTFSFDTKANTGLACVFYGVQNAAESAAFRDLLVKRYGKPASESGLPAIGMQTLTWKIGRDGIDLNMTEGEPAYVMQCKEG